jgi:hypothetical protein
MANSTHSMQVDSYAFKWKGARQLRCGAKNAATKIFFNNNQPQGTTFFSVLHLT